MLRDDRLEIDGLGQSAKLGDLYDWPTQQFTGQSLFRQPIDEKLVDKSPFGEFTLDKPIYTTNTFHEKFRIFNIESPDIQLSIISELFPFYGSSKFYMKKLTTKNKFQTYWTFTYQYSQESISLTNDEYKTLIDNNTLLNSNATHIAISLTYGFTAVICLESKNINHDNSIVNNSINRQRVNNIMTVILDDIRKSWNQSKQTYDKLEEYVSFNYYSDIERNNTPANLFEAIQYIRDDILLQDMTKLKPIKIKLTSLEFMRFMYKMPLKKREFYRLR